jgi:peroxin-11B
MIADLVIYHPTISHYLKFAATTVGRDKLLRTLQYFARFYAWVLLRRHTIATTTTPAASAAAAAAPWAATKKQLGIVRKILRVGKNIEHLRAAAVALDAPVGTIDPVVRYATVGRQLGYFAYLSADAGTVLDAAGIRRWEGADKLQRQAYRFWTAALLCSIACQAYTLFRLRRRDVLVDRKEAEGVVESKRINVYVVVLWRCGADGCAYC